MSDTTDLNLGLNRLTCLWRTEGGNELAPTCDVLMIDITLQGILNLVVGIRDIV